MLTTYISILISQYYVIYQQSLRYTPTASPPSEVSLYFVFMSLAVSHMVLTTLSKGTFALAGSESNASSAALMALMAPMQLRSIHGICTNPPMGSQVRPRWCSMAISAAMSTCSGLPPISSVRAAAAMAEDTPISAWQPPMAAEMVAPFLKILPISPATRRNCFIWLKVAWWFSMTI